MRLVVSGCLKEMGPGWFLKKKGAPGNQDSESRTCARLEGLGPGCLEKPRQASWLEGMGPGCFNQTHQATWLKAGCART